MAEWLLYEHDDGRHAVAPSAEAATFAKGDPAWRRVGPVEVQPGRTVAPGDLDPRTALTYAKRMKDYCEAFDGRDWANVMVHGSPDEQNLAHALDNLTECAAMLMNMAGRVAGVSGVAPSPAPLPHDRIMAVLERFGRLDFLPFRVPGTSRSEKTQCRIFATQELADAARAIEREVLSTDGVSGRQDQTKRDHTPMSGKDEQ